MPAHRFIAHLAVLTAITFGTAIASAGTAHPWVDIVDETAVRLPTPPNDPAVTTVDESEKSYAYADVDLDGDLDLVIVRKQPWSTTGRRTNVLLMNEGITEGHAVDGVLIDRTAAYATLSTVTSDLGFLTPTNDRDVALADVNNDGYPDIITATASPITNGRAFRIRVCTSTSVTMKVSGLAFATKNRAFP